jgi:hypothetical protein
MSLVELLDKKARLNKKIEAEDNRVRAIEDRKLAELKDAFECKQRALNKWNSDCRDFLIDKTPVERFNAMMNQYSNERAIYQIERLVGKVDNAFLVRIQPKSMSELLSLYKLDDLFESLGNCAKPQTATMTEKEVSKAKQEYEAVKTKIAKRRQG